MNAPNERNYMPHLEIVSKRISIENYYLKMAHLVSERSTCARRKVGCFLVDKDNHVISTGYNGVPSGIVHCIDKPCAGANAKSGTELDKCESIHAEINAIAHCLNPSQIYAVYVTVSPCVHCIKALLATPCEWLFFNRQYAHAESLELWEKGGRFYRLI